MIIRKDSFSRILFVLFIIYLSNNYCTTFKLTKYHHHHYYYLPRTHSSSLLPLQKRYELFEPLDTNLVRAMFIGGHTDRLLNHQQNIKTTNIDDSSIDDNIYNPRNDRNNNNDYNNNNLDEEYYINSKNHLGSLMRYG
ncbi:unnamed protein product [Schistosoma rodhaini]|uniref:Uncharacterized protein n=1 Tax=Schistosoma rodhaini TaxID=6188 RepID=A0A183QP42_9TREM|nr:unnamed protein product [Schistosoma rodhaini]